MDAEAVDRFFDRLTEALPRHVSEFWPRVIGLSVAAYALFVHGLPLVKEDKRKHAASKDDLKRHRHLLLLAVVLGVCRMLYEFVKDATYTVTSYGVNRQHKVNVRWLRQYMNALS